MLQGRLQEFQPCQIFSWRYAVIPPTVLPTVLGRLKYTTGPFGSQDSWDQRWPKM
jgi:hypothetical protein